MFDIGIVTPKKESGIVSCGDLVAFRAKLFVK